MTDKNTITADTIAEVVEKISQEPTQEEVKKYWEFQDEILPLQKRVWAYILNNKEPITIEEYKAEYIKAYKKVYGEIPQLKELKNDD